MCALLRADDVDAAWKTTSAITDFRVSGFLFQTYSSLISRNLKKNQVDIQ